MAKTAENENKRMRVLISFSFLLPVLAAAQIGMGQWRLHVPNTMALDAVAVDEVVFAAYQTGVMEFDTEAGEVSMWDNVNGLSDITISCLGYDANTKSVFVGYENGNLDQIEKNRVTNIPAIVLAQLQGSKRIYKIVAHAGFVYCATGFGIVKIDPDKSEVKDTYYPTNGLDPIVDIAFRGDSIFALSETQLFRGKLSNPALADPQQWVIDTRVPEITADTVMYKDVEVLDNRLFVQKNGVEYGNDSIFEVLGTGWQFVSDVGFSLEISGLGVLDNKLTVYAKGAIIQYNADFSFHAIFQTYSFGNNVNGNKAVFVGAHYWIADDELGLVKYFNGGASERIVFSGPPRNDFFALDWNNGVLAAVPGGIQSKFPNFMPAGVYFFEDEEWTLKDRYNQTLWNETPMWDNISVAINPKNPNQVATGTYSGLPVSLLNVDGQVTDTFSMNNSTLKTSSEGNGWYLISDLKFDENGNLWVLNGFNVNPLKLRTAEGTWHEFNLGSIASNKQTKRMVMDYNGNLWAAITNVGLAGYKPGGSITDPSDDKKILLTTGTSTGALPSADITALAVDFDNEIWIGTDNGFAVLYNSDGAFDAGLGNYNAQRIKLEFEGNVEYVLGNTSVTDIEVDGGNRKWFATANSGVILLSADGLEILRQFTTENSPLISNNIIDLEIDHKSGEVFIVTDKGLVSYRSDASYEDPEYSDVQVFPNPARPDFDGPITIQGIMYDSDVKITDVGGNVVYKTTSNGGTATWDGRTLSGEKVTTGVYLIWTASNTAKGRYVGKVVVVN